MDSLEGGVPFSGWGLGLVGEVVFIAYWMSERMVIYHDQRWFIVVGQEGSNLLLQHGQTDI